MKKLKVKSGWIFYKSFLGWRRFLYIEDTHIGHGGDILAVLQAKTEDDADMIIGRCDEVRFWRMRINWRDLLNVPYHYNSRTTLKRILKGQD